jgi:hypothetical protein
LGVSVPYLARALVRDAALLAADAAGQLTALAAVRAERLIGAGLRAFVQFSPGDASIIVAAAIAESVRATSNRLPAVARDATAIGVLVSGRVAIGAVLRLAMATAAITKLLR